jgi:hypothetical protein
MRTIHLFVAFGFASVGPVGKDATLAHKEAVEDEREKKDDI